ncbi:MAG: hypothetical protein AAF846_29455 [Chloroflexota bacterium]
MSLLRRIQNSNQKQLPSRRQVAYFWDDIKKKIRCRVIAKINLNTDLESMNDSEKHLYIWEAFRKVCIEVSAEENLIIEKPEVSSLFQSFIDEWEKKRDHCPD